MSLITCYNRLPLTFSHGQGMWLYDTAGRKYLDTFSGIGVCGLGHAHPDIVKTIQTQAAKFIHIANGFCISQQEQLANKLTTLTHMQQAFFANSGAEANEAAIKLARLYGHHRHIESPAIIVMEGAFHGRTLATLTASGSRKVQAGYEPLVPGFLRAPLNDISAIKTIAENRHDIVAVMLEPIQGESGVHVVDPGYLQQLSVFCQEQEWLLILDEVQTGNGRTGPLYAYMDLHIQPDILTTAKGLGNGVPIGACLMRDKACDLFQPGKHGSTFGGNPLACATALTVLDVIERDNLGSQVTKRSILLRNELQRTLREHPHVRAIRGKGYMLGIALDRPAQDIRALAAEHGLLLNVTAESVIRLLPALIMNDAEMNFLIEQLVKVIDLFCQQSR